MRKYASVVIRVVAATVLLYLFVDVPLARWSVPFSEHEPRFIDNLFELVRQYGQWFSVLVAISFMLTLDPAKRKELYQFVLAVVVAAAFVNIVKLVTGRARPEDFIAGDPMWKLFGGFHAKSHYTSFPSAHATAAFAFAAALSVIYPSARSVFYALAVLCGISRIGDAQHYASDVVAGAAIGAWIGAGVFRWRWSSDLASRLARPREEKVSPLPPERGQGEGRR